MRYGSVCSGIEAASVAWEGLEGWEPAWFAEIDDFPSRVLAYRYPHIPNRGDFTKIGKDADETGTIDLLVGGTPCQSFSVAGHRAGLDDARGNLALEFLALARRLRPRWILWENVPGVLSSHSGQTEIAPAEWEESADFGQFLQALQECGYSCAWRVLDAQHFGVPQRRRRIFVVGYLGDDWRPAAAVLFEPQSLSGNIAPRRAKRKSPALSTQGRTGSGSSEGSLTAYNANPDWTTQETDVAPTMDCRVKDGPRRNQGGVMVFASTGHGKYAEGPGTLRASSGDLSQGGSEMLAAVEAYGGNNTSGPIDVATACNAHPGGRYDFESETLVTQSQVTHSLRADGFDASEDGTGRGTPLVPVEVYSVSENQRSEVLMTDYVRNITSGGGKPGQGYPAVAAFYAGQGAKAGSLGYAEEQSPTLKSAPSGLNTTPTIVGTLSTNSGPRSHDAGNFHTNQGVDAGHVIPARSAVRRLTPEECEALQGFPRGWTNVPVGVTGKGNVRRVKWAVDGPRYKAIGNSMAVPCMRWLGERIQKVEEILQALQAEEEEEVA